MKKLMKSCLAAAMALALCVSLLPMTVFADDSDPAICPSCGAPATVTNERDEGCVTGITYTYKCAGDEKGTIHYYGVTVPGPGHNYADGKCTVCGEDDPDYTAPAPETCEHDWVWKVTDENPVCEAKGERTQICTKCGVTGETEITTLAHEYSKDDLIPEVPATCTEPGVRAHYKCTRCGVEFGTGTAAAMGLEIKPLGHSYGGWRETKAATCTEAGEEKRECTRENCNASEDRPIDMLTHGVDENEDGKCDNCGEDIVPDTTEPECAHESGAWLVRDNHWFACDDCGKNVFSHTPTKADCLTPSHCPYENCLGNVEGSKDPNTHAEACESSYVDNGDGTHDQTLTCGVVVVDDEAHKDTNSDKLCDQCGAEMPSTEEPEEPSDGTFTTEAGYKVTVTLAPASASGHGGVVIRTVQVNVDGDSNVAMSIDGSNRGYGKSATKQYYVDIPGNTMKTVTVTIDGETFTVSFDMAEGITVVEDHEYGEWITDKEATETEDGHAYRVCTVKMLNGRDCTAEEEKTIPATGNGGDNGDGGDGDGDNNEPTTPTTPTTPTNPGSTTGGGTTVTDPDPVDSGADLTTIEEEEVPLAGLPFDLAATDELTRGLFAQIIYWFEGEPDAGQTSFTDVAEDHEYAQAIAWGEANGILLGYGDGTYRPDNGITREEMVLILNRYARYKASELTVEVDGDPDDVMLWAEAEEIVNDFFDRLSGEEA